jgi:hypothetical protein
LACLSLSLSSFFSQFLFLRSLFLFIIVVDLSMVPEEKMVVVMSGKTNFSRKMDEIKGLVNWKMEKEGLSMWIEKQRLRSEGEKNNNYGFHDCGGCAAIGGADRCGWCKGREGTNLLQFYFSLSFFSFFLMKMQNVIFFSLV